VTQRQIQLDCWYERANSSVLSRLLLQGGTVWNWSTQDVVRIWESFHFRSEL